MITRDSRTWDRQCCEFFTAECAESAEKREKGNVLLSALSAFSAVKIFCRKRGPAGAGIVATDMIGSHHAESKEGRRLLAGVALFSSI
jgi:hypothetical protein